MLLNPIYPITTTKVLALKATVLLLLSLLINARVQMATGSAFSLFMLLLQTLVFLAISGGLWLAAGWTAIYSTQNTSLLRTKPISLHNKARGGGPGHFSAQH